MEIGSGELSFVVILLLFIAIALCVFLFILYKAILELVEIIKTKKSGSNQMKFSEYPRLGLPGTIMGIVVIAILSGWLLLGIWNLPIPIAHKIGATIFVVFFGGGLMAGLIGGYKLLHHEVFFPKAEEK